MNALEQYLKKLDVSSYGHRDSNTIDKEFQTVAKQLIEEGETELAAIAELNRQVFAVQKSFDIKLDPEKGTITGLKWQISGTQTLEDGTQIPIYWPNVAGFTQKDFEYFEKRYNESNNLYIKTEYGLMAYFGGATEYSKHNDFKKQLSTELFELSKAYYKKADAGGAKNFYCLDFSRTLELAFSIAEKSKIEPELTNLSKYIYQIHQNWDITKEGTLRILLDLTGLMTEFYGLFNKIIDFKKILEKNTAGAKELEKSNLWGAMYLVDRNITLENKHNESFSSLRYKAVLYEKLAIESNGKNNLAGVNFAEHALRIHQQLDDVENIGRLEKLYNNLRGKIVLTEIRQDLPKDYINELNERIRKSITENNEWDILEHFINTPWYDKIQNIRDRSAQMDIENAFMSMVPTSIVDKFGNTVDVFNNEEDIERFNFWNTYTFDYQMGTQTMRIFFDEAYKAGKLRYDSTISFLESTWFNEIIIRNHYGHQIEIRPIDTIKPGLKRIFQELDRYAEDDKYQMDLVTITDSLTLKIEGLLRYLCEKLGIATFKTRQKGTEKLVMEKLIDDLLADIAHKPPFKPDQVTNFDEEDRIFIKYVMTEKAGINLRNLVAHSLMDIYEYSFEHILVLFCIIMKLSKYRFIENKTEK